MRVWVVLALIVAAMAVGVVLYRANYAKNDASQGSMGETTGAAGARKFPKAPEFVLPDEFGKLQGLEALRGDVILIHFWASWCPPCVGELPKIIKSANAYKDKKFKLVVISLDKNWKDADRVLPNGKLPPNVFSLLDSANKVSAAYGSYEFPETYLLTRDLRIVTKWIGPQKWNSEEFKSLFGRMF